MPRQVVHRAGKVEKLCILDKNGTVDEELEPDIDDDTLLKMHRAMLYGRRLDERMLKLQRQGRIGTFAPIQGQEAAQIGSAIHLTKEDWLVPSFRETAAQLLRGATAEDIWLFAAGYNEGLEIPEDARDLPICVPVASQITHAVGLAYAAKYRGEDSIVMGYHGDGATSEGDFHEGLNFASVYQVPVIFICQNNQWAISEPIKKQMHSKTIAQKAAAYDMEGLQVDGNDVLAVYAGVKEAVDRARSSGAPSLVECVTYRMNVHTTADDPTRYRDEEEVEKWRERDPIDRFQAYLKAKDLLSDGDIDDMEKEFKETLKSAWQATEQKIEELAVSDPGVIFDHVYAEEWPHLKDQRARFLDAVKTGDAGGS